MMTVHDLVKALRDVAAGGEGQEVLVRSTQSYTVSTIVAVRRTEPGKRIEIVVQSR